MNPKDIPYNEHDKEASLKESIKLLNKQIVDWFDIAARKDDEIEHLKARIKKQEEDFALIQLKLQGIIRDVEGMKHE